MNVSLRSQMVAGIAALGATAVAIVPIAQQDVLPSVQRVSAAIELSALANPVAVALDTTSDINTYLLDTFTFDEVPYVWPENFYGNDGFYAPFNFGILPDAINQFSSGALSAWINNLSGYGWAGIDAVFKLGIGASDSIFNTPGAVVTAVQELAAGNPQGAIDALVAGIVDPIRYGLSVGVAAISYVVDNAIQNVGTLFTSFLPYVARGVANSVLKGAGYVIQSTIQTVVKAVQDLGTSGFQAAWNTAVEGLLGTTGTLGNVVALTLGPGITEEIDGDTTVTIPSTRSVLTSELQRLGSFKSAGDDGIGNDPFFPPSAAAAKSAAAVAAVAAAPAAEAVEAESAPTADAPADVADAPKAVTEAPKVADDAGDSTAAGDSSAAAAQSSSPRPAKRAARAAEAVKAAVKAATKGQRPARSAR